MPEANSQQHRTCAKGDAYRTASNNGPSRKSQNNAGAGEVGDQAMTMLHAERRRIRFLLIAGNTTVAFVCVDRRLRHRPADLFACEMDV